MGSLIGFLLSLEICFVVVVLANRCTMSIPVCCVLVGNHDGMKTLLIHYLVEVAVILTHRKIFSCKC